MEQSGVFNVKLLKDQQVLKVFKDQRVLRVLLVHKVYKVLSDQQDQQVRYQLRLDRQVRKEFKVQQDH
jgi:hypothetical protein